MRSCNRDNRRAEIDIQTLIDDNGASASFRVRQWSRHCRARTCAHIFDSFFSTKDAGIGIGLAICHSIISRAWWRHFGLKPPEWRRTFPLHASGRSVCRSRLPAPWTSLQELRHASPSSACASDNETRQAIAHILPHYPRYRSIYPLDQRDLDPLHDTLTRPLPIIIARPAHGPHPMATTASAQ